MSNQGYEEEYEDEDVIGAGNESWEEYPPQYAEPDDGSEAPVNRRQDDALYQQGFDEGAATVGMDAYDAGIVRDLVQGNQQLQEERAEAEFSDSLERQWAAAERDLGRPLSAGEWKYLEARAYDPDYPADIGSEIAAYQTLPKAERMQRSIEAMWGSPDTEEVLSGPEDNYGLPDDATPHERREARDAWSLQRARINRGELEYEDDE